MQQILQLLEVVVVVVLAILLFFIVMSLAIPVALAAVILDTFWVIKGWVMQDAQAHTQVDLERISKDRASRTLRRNLAQDTQTSGLSGSAKAMH